MKPFFSYYGGKWRDCAKYPAPQFDTIIEPFAGSAGYSVRHYAHQVFLCDLDPIIAGVWRYLIAATPDEIENLPDVPHDGSIDDLDVCHEARHLIGFWLNKGNARPAKQPSTWMKSNTRPASYWGAEIRDRIASQVSGIKHWQIIEGNYSNCTIETPATWFIDPPYQGKGIHYKCSAKNIDFDELGKWSRSRVGQVIACENTGANWLPFQQVMTVRSSRPGTRTAEAIWLNNEPEESVAA
jgi:hypothetical protein